MPEATSTPAVLKGRKQDIVSGDYSYASFQALLRLIGRVEGAKHEVLESISSRVSQPPSDWRG